jgi:hypothetical protein
LQALWEPLQLSIKLSVQILHNSAIAGFQASCSQTAYSLGVDTVILENSNTKMRFTMNYALQDGSASPTVTQWTRVKLNYLLVSADKFGSYGTALSDQGANYLWAGSVEITPTQSGNYGLYGAGSLFGGVNNDLNDVCGFLSLAASTSTSKFDREC